MQITFSAPDLRIDFLADKRLRLLSPPGELVMELPDAELQRLVEAALKTLAEQQGAAIESVRVDLNATSPRVAQLTVHAKVRKMIPVSAVAGARVELDDSLTATLSNLSVKVEGMLGAMIESAIRPKLAAFEGRRFPLAGKLPSWLVVSDVALITGAVHRVVAKVMTRG